MDFLLDTGAAYSALHPTDAVERVGIPLNQLASPSQWRDLETLSGVGGRARYYVVDAQYLFLQEDRSERRLRARLRIAQPMPGSDRLPSLLGWDVLQHFEVVANWATKMISLN